MSEFEKIEQEAVERGEQEVNEKLGIQGDQGGQPSQGQGDAQDPQQGDQQDQGQG